MVRIAFSSKNQPTGSHGRKDHMIWLHRDDGTSRLMGVASLTTYGKWCAEVDNMAGRIRFFEANTLAKLRREVKDCFQG